MGSAQSGKVCYVVGAFKSLLEQADPNVICASVSRRNPTSIEEFLRVIFSEVLRGRVPFLLKKYRSTCHPCGVSCSSVAGLVAIRDQQKDARVR